MYTSDVYVVYVTYLNVYVTYLPTETYTPDIYVGRICLRDVHVLRIRCICLTYVVYTSDVYVVYVDV